jgi:hypothetical protein
LFGLAVLASLCLELGEAALLAGLFIAQFALGGFLRADARTAPGANQELIAFSLIYLVLSLIFGVRARKTIGQLFRRRPRGLHAARPYTLPDRYAEQASEGKTPASRSGRT